MIDLNQTTKLNFPLLQWAQVELEDCRSSYQRRCVT